jgi:sugar O-acyltransferase (sialic acid O-acetyltransferase NeuD family)
MELVLIGSGGFANEIKAEMKNNIKCFVEDAFFNENNNNIYPLSEFDSKKYVVLVAIGDSQLRKSLIERLPKDTIYTKYISPLAQILDKNIEFGEGSIVCAGVIITTNCKFGKHTHLNLHTSIGHDCTIGDYFTTAPGARVSGNCNIGDVVYLGTNSSIKQKINICDEVIIGSNGCVVKDINKPGTYVGVPVKIIKNGTRSL